MSFDVPRAQIVGWKIVCPGVDIDGQVGEQLESHAAAHIAKRQGK